MNGFNTPFENLKIEDVMNTNNTNNTPDAPAATATPEAPVSKTKTFWDWFTPGRSLMTLVVLWIGVFLWNVSHEFKSASEFQYSGGFGRRSVARVGDLFRHKSVSHGFNIIGQQYAVYYVGDKTFVQRTSGGPAIEVAKN